MQCNELQQLSTQQLDELLQAQLQKDDGDPAEIRAILGILKNREKDMPFTIGDREKLAWERYKLREKEAEDKPAGKQGWVLRVAGVAVALGVLTASVVYSVQADGLWGRIVRWTDSVIEFFSPDSADGGHRECGFHTDHPGLQELYDSVTALGVTEPVVPMWLPEGYELIFFQEMGSDNKTTVMAVFQNEEKILNYTIDIYLKNVPNQYQKDETGVTTYEIENDVYYITRNYDKWVAVWTKENIECSISVDCQEDELKKILRSIHDKEEAK